MNTKKSHYCVGGGTYISPSCEIISLHVEQLICESGNFSDSYIDPLTEGDTLNM